MAHDGAEPLTAAVAAGLAAREDAEARTPEARMQALAPYLNAGDRAYVAGETGAAHALYRQGLAQAEAFVAAGESASGVREQMLRLYANANAGVTAEPAAKHALCRQGLAQAEAFIAAGERASGVREEMLRLYVDAVVTAEPAAKRALYQQGLAQAEAFVAAGERASGVREQMLRLYVGAVAMAEPAAKRALYRQGLMQAEAFVAAGEHASGVREAMLRLYLNAGVTAEPAAAHALYRQGLAQAEAFVAAGEGASGVREMMLRLYTNLSTVEARWNRLVGCLRYQTQAQALVWLGPQPAPVDRELLDGLEQNRAFSEPTLSGLGNVAVLPLWHDVLRHWLTRMQPAADAGLDRDGLLERVDVAHALMQLDAAAAGAGFAGHYVALDRLIARIEGPWRKRRDGLAARLREAARAVQPEDSEEDSETTDADGCAALLGAWLDKATLWQRLRHAGRRRRVSQWLADWRATADMPALEASAHAPTWQAIDRTERALAGWLAGQIVRHGGFPGSLAEPAAVALGILLAHQPGTPEAVVAAWAEALPWHDDAALDTAWAATQPQRWTLFDDGIRAALYQWLGTMPDARLTVDPAIANLPEEATLDAAVRAWTAGERAPLRELLQGAWFGVQPVAAPVARCLAALRTGTALPSLFPASGDDAVRDPDIRARALAAVIVGDVQQAIARALLGWLDARLPLDRGAIDAGTLQTLRQRFSELISLHPGPPEHRELGDRLHGWCQRLLSLTLAEPAPDPERLWATLEIARIGLNGLRGALPGEDWQRDTAEAVRKALLATPAVPPRAGLAWPPLQRWRERLHADGGLPSPPGIDACRCRLRSGEALVQLFPDLDTGRLWALWLTREQPVELRALPAAADWPAWQAPAGAPPGVLDRWNAWVADNKKHDKEHSHRFPPLWAELEHAGALRCAADTLADWARAQAVAHLVVLLPAPLAQLPWEALAPFADATPSIERAVNLSDWRTAPASGTGAAWAAYDDADPSRSGPYIACEAQEAAERHGNKPRRIRAPAAGGLTAFDLLALLHGSGPGHLIVHGRYEPDDPYRSRLELAVGEHLYAWTLGALGVGCPELVLSACQANVSGRATRARLGPVGLGPALIAGGARCVLGPLWSCTQLASWMFHRCLDDAIERAPQAAWPQRLASARAQMRALTGEQIRAALIEALGAKGFEDVEHDLHDLRLDEPGRPFDNPYHWAAFVLLGDPFPAAGPAAAASAPAP